MASARTDLSVMTEEERAEHRRQKNREKAARWRDKHGEKHRAAEKARYWADPELARAKLRVRSKARYANETPEQKKKRQEYNSKWHRENHDPEKRRASALKSLYDLTPEDYERLLAAQGGRCAVCARTPDQEAHGVLHIDHCHSTRRVRGLLCGNHNTALGLCHDSSAELIALARYVDQNP